MLILAPNTEKPLNLSNKDDFNTRRRTEIANPNLES